MQTICWISKLHLCGAVAIHIQEGEEAAVLFVPAAPKRKLHELVDGDPPELLVLPLAADLEQEPARFQGVAWSQMGGGGGARGALENVEVGNKGPDPPLPPPCTHCPLYRLAASVFTWVLQSALATR